MVDNQGGAFAAVEAIFQANQVFPVPRLPKIYPVLLS
jgi:hypothetical protein